MHGGCLSWKPTSAAAANSLLQRSEGCRRETVPALAHQGRAFQRLRTELCEQLLEQLVRLQDLLFCRRGNEGLDRSIRPLLPT